MSQSTSLKIQSLFGSPLRILLMILLSLPLFSTPLSLKSTPYYSPKTSATVVIFYTSWCPPCKRSLTMLKEIEKSHPNLSIRRVCVDDTDNQKKALAYGLAKSVPLILVADRSGTVVKRFQTLPNKTNLNDLIGRIEEGRLENGTLPIEQRVDTWKMDRKGM